MISYLEVPCPVCLKMPLFTKERKIRLACPDHHLVIRADHWKEFCINALAGRLMREFPNSFTVGLITGIGEFDWGWSYSTGRQHKEGSGFDSFDDSIIDACNLLRSES